MGLLGSECSCGHLVTTPLTPRLSCLLQFPVPLRPDLWGLASHEVQRRNVAYRAVQPNPVVIFDESFHQSASLFEARGVGRTQGIRFYRLVVQGVEAEALRAEIARLHAELESVEDAIEIQSFGFYEPRYGFETSKEYVDRVDAIRDEQKAMIRDKSATVCPRNWVVDGSLAKGRQMMAEHSQLMLRAFNGDCDAAIARVRYDNVARIEKRTSCCLSL